MSYTHQVSLFIFTFITMFLYILRTVSHMLTCSLICLSSWPGGSDRKTWAACVMNTFVVACIPASTSHLSGFKKKISNVISKVGFWHVEGIHKPVLISQSLITWNVCVANMITNSNKNAWKILQVILFIQTWLHYSLLSLSLRYEQLTTYPAR